MATRIQDVELLCKALADVTRLRILAILMSGEVCVCDIHEALKLPQPKVSRHLAYLRKAGLVDARREGLWMHYHVTDMSDPVLRTIRDAVGHALTHVDPVRRDVTRIQKATGCCAVQPTNLTATLACCSPAPRTGSPARR